MSNLVKVLRGHPQGGEPLLETFTHTTAIELTSVRRPNLVRGKVAVIVATGGYSPALAAKAATKTIPLSSP